MAEESPEVQAAREEANKKTRQRRAEEFREQCYLISKMEQLARDNANVGTKYKNFTVIEGNNASPNVNINQLFWFKDQAALMGLSPAQLSLLVPKIRVFVVTYDGNPFEKANKTEKEIKFQGNSYDLEKLLQDPSSRGQNLGLKSFSWQFNGTDPWTAANLLQASMTLFGDSLRVFERGSEYDSLLMFPHAGNQMEIKVVVGWNAPKKAGEGPVPLLSETEIKAIKDQSMTMLLTLTEHEFKFAQDGSFNLELKYKGRIDVAMHQVDLLGPSNAEERKTDLALAGVRTRIQSSKKKLREPRSLGPERSDYLENQPVRVPEDDGLPEAAAAFLMEQEEDTMEFAMNAAPGDINAQKMIIDAMQKGDVTAEEMTFDVVKSKILIGRGAERMNRIVKAIENLAPNSKQPSVASRVYNVRVDAQKLDAYFDKYGGLSTIDREQADKNKKDSGARAAEMEKAREERKKLIEGGMSEEEAEKQVPGPKNDPPPKVPQTAPPPKSTGPYNRSFDLKKVVERAHPGDGAIVIPFIFLGDLLEAILGICKFQLQAARINFIVGTMIFNDPITKKSSLINIADIPISLRRFSAWFHKRYNADRPTNRIPLKDFLQSLMVDLIRPGLTSECFLGADTIGGNINRIGGLVVTSHKNIPKGRISVDKLQDKEGGLFHSPKGESQDPLYNNFLFTSMMDPKPPTTGDKYKDSALGIMHYHLGRNKGILKNANFSRNNIAGLTEHRLTRETGSPIDRMRQPYNVDLELIGNIFMRPGTMFFITPTVPGLGAQRIANRLGIGGYYVTQGVDCTISPGSFLMNVKGIYNNSATEGQKKNVAARQSSEGEGVKSLQEEEGK